MASCSSSNYLVLYTDYFAVHSWCIRLLVYIGNQLMCYKRESRSK